MMLSVPAYRTLQSLSSKAVSRTGHSRLQCTAAPPSGMTSSSVDLLPPPTRAAPRSWFAFACSVTHATQGLLPTQFSFGPHTVHATEVFAKTDLSFAFVNLKPVVPGHVLVSPLRVARRFADLSKEEVSDLWLLAQRVGSIIEPHFKASSLTFAIQDGASAGQTVPHVHIHILPRKSGDFEKNDEVYDAIDAASKEMRSKIAGEKLDLDKERVVRTQQQMADEASVLRALLLK